jgi:hypothetical protein
VPPFAKNAPLIGLRPKMQTNARSVQGARTPIMKLDGAIA